MRMSLRNLLLLGAATTVTALPIWGQASPASRPEVDLAFTYLAQHSNLTTTQPFWRQGGVFELSAQGPHGLGMAMNIAGSTATNIRGTGIDLNTVTSTFGPRYTWHSRKVSVFGQGLIGVSNAWNSYFPQNGGAITSTNAFALQVGGGIDLPVARHLAIRPIQTDWVRTQFPNGTTNVQNNLRLSAGFVVRLR